MIECIVCYINVFRFFGRFMEWSTFEPSGPSAWCWSLVSVVWSDYEYHSLLPPPPSWHGMLLHCRVTLSPAFNFPAPIYCNTWVEKGHWLRINCLAQEPCWPELKPRPLDLKTRVLTTSKTNMSPTDLGIRFSTKVELLNLERISCLKYFQCT